LRLNFSRDTALAAILLLLAGTVPTKAQDAVSAIQPWLEQLKTCTGKTAPRLAVIGLERDDLALAAPEAESLRLAIENAIAERGASLMPAADVTRIKALREGTTGLSGEEAEAQIRTAFEGDAAIFFADMARSAERASFRLVAITPKADCKATSSTLSLPIGKAVLADPGQLMKEAVSNLMDAAPDLKTIAVESFATNAGHSACASTLTELLLVALDEEARSPNRALNGKTLGIRKAAPDDKLDEGAAFAHGALALDQQGNASLSLSFTRNGASLAPVARTPIAVDRLNCDPTVRPFLEHVAASAKTDRGQFDMSAVPFSKGQRLDIALTIKEPSYLFCWILAPDETAYVLLPTDRNARAAASRLQGNMNYPRSFGLSEIVLEQSFDNLASCFAVSDPLPEALQATWNEHMGSKDQPAKLMEKAAVNATLEAFRALPGLVEASARIVVK
jgi:hypothetical protein